MKAKIIREDRYHAPQFAIDEIVEIIPGMETDAEGIWNCPAGKLVLCKKEDGTFAYNTMLDMQIVDASPDWSQFRAEAAKDILCAMIANPTSFSFGGKELKTLGDYQDAAVGLAGSLIKRLKGETE